MDLFIYNYCVLEFFSLYPYFYRNFFLSLTMKYSGFNSTTISASILSPNKPVNVPLTTNAPGFVISYFGISKVLSSATVHPKGS